MQFVQGGPPEIADFGGNSPAQQGVVKREPSSIGMLYARRVTIGIKQMLENNMNNRECEVFQVLKSKLVEMEKAEIELRTLKT
jgi:hypothetical protein